MVDLLRKRDEVAAVTGDGTNDIAALKAVVVGLSMGIDVAQQASDKDHFIAANRVGDE